MIALSAVGSATLLFSCTSKTETTTYDYETLMTESSENRSITMMENGKRSYTFVSPLMEGYSLATNPYQEFRRGIKMTTYTDSLSLVDATITANYAIYYERQKLWEAKGNVVIIKNNRNDGDTTVTGHTEVYTQQLFWNATTKKIYSNVDTKVLQPDGWHFGVGFDADEDLKNIHFRKYSSEMEFDMSQPTEEERAAREAEKKEREAENKDSKESKKGKESKKEGKKETKREPERRGKNDIGDARFSPSSSSHTLKNNSAGTKQGINAPLPPSAGGRPTNKINSETTLSNRETVKPGATAPKRQEIKLESQGLNAEANINSDVKLRSSRD